MTAARVENESRFVDVAALAAVGNLALRARLVVEGFITGLHPSPYKGFSAEFSAYRPYQPGDDPRRIDWRAFARVDRYYVKEFDEETNLRFYVCVDASASMGYPPGGPWTKLDYAATCAAALAYLALNQKDAVGTALFADELKTLVPPRSQRRHFQNVAAALGTARPEGKTDLFAVLDALAQRMPRRGLFALFTDLWDVSPRAREGLKALKAAKHEVILFHILDPAEERFPFRGAAAFVDMESGEEVALDAAHYRASYVGAVAAFRGKARMDLGTLGIDYVPVTTDTPPGVALVSYLERRRRLP